MTVETARILAEILFDITASVAFIVVGVFGVLVLYRLLRIVKEIESLLQKLHDTSHTVRDMMKSVVQLPILSYILKKRSAAKTQKGRKKLRYTIKPMQSHEKENS